MYKVQSVCSNAEKSTINKWHAQIKQCSFILVTVLFHLCLSVVRLNALYTTYTLPWMQIVSTQTAGTTENIFTNHLLKHNSRTESHAKDHIAKAKTAHAVNFPKQKTVASACRKQNELQPYRNMWYSSSHIETCDTALAISKHVIWLQPYWKYVIQQWCLADALLGTFLINLFQKLIYWNDYAHCLTQALCWQCFVDMTTAMTVLRRDCFPTATFLCENANWANLVLLASQYRVWISRWSKRSWCSHHDLDP